MLFDFLESIHRQRKTRTLSWGHSYYFECILSSYLDQEGQITFRKDVVLAEKETIFFIGGPLPFEVQNEEFWNQEHSEHPSFSSQGLADNKGMMPSTKSLRVCIIGVY